MASPGVEEDDVYVVNLDKVREIGFGPDYMAGVKELWLVNDEPAFMERVRGINEDY